jgi:aminoglycoside/choline kinase family phosphotransferase
MSFLAPDALEQLVSPTVRELFGGRDLRLQAMPGGASLRRYHRAEWAGEGRRSVVVMETGDPKHSDEVVKPGEVAELPFLNVQRYLASGGVPVPEVYRYDATHGLVYLEDLGDVTFESRVVRASDDERARYYRLAIDQLVGMQRYAVRNVDQTCVAFHRGFDYDLLKWELDHFVEYGIDAQGIQLAATARAELEEIFVGIAKRLADAPRIFVHRDYQSRNLMVEDAPKSGDPRLRIIDFQDALLGTAAYDLVGLLRDSYIQLSPSLLDDLLDYHIARAGADGAAFRELFHLQTVQRKLKDAGRFVFIERVKKIPGFMQHIPSSLAYVSSALDRLPHLKSLKTLLAPHFPAFRS